MNLKTPKGKFICVTDFNITSVYAGFYEGRPDKNFKKETMQRHKENALSDNSDEKVTVIEPDGENLPKASCTVFFNDLEDGGCIVFYSDLQSNPIEEFLSIIDNQKWSNITRPWMF